MQKRTTSLDDQIARFIYNNNTCKQVVNTSQTHHKSIHRQRENLNALFIGICFQSGPLSGEQILQKFIKINLCT